MGILHKLMKQRCLHAFDQFNPIHRMEYVQNMYNKYETKGGNEGDTIDMDYAVEQRFTTTNNVQDSRMDDDHKVKEFTAEHIKRLCKFLKDKSQKKVCLPVSNKLPEYLH